MSGKFKNLRFALVAATLTMSANGFAQTVIKGNVTDNTGEPIIGASVVEDGNANNGGVTDIDGNFTVTLKGNSKKLKISYVGMKPQVVNVSGKSVINVKLEDDATSLNDVVVIGYGSVKKKDLTGSVATVNSETLAAVPVASASEALTGKLAGVQVTTSEGSPDADVKIRVRGGGSITQSNDPLFIVDGFPVESISDIPATDIEDITVLKDASSTAIYGSRGANGVILVTTKSGKAGKVNVSYNAYYSVKKIAKKLDTLSPYDYAKWQYELALLKNSKDLSSYTDYFGNYQDMDLYKDIEGNDWQDIVYGRTGNTFNQNLNITGGSETVKYAFSYAHMNDKAIQIGSSYKRDNFSLKMNTKPTKHTTLDFQVRYSDTDIRGGGANDATGSYDTDRRLKYALIYTPIPLSNLDESAGSSDDDLGNLYNPVTSQYDNDRKKERKQLNFSGAFGWEIFKNFKAKTELGYDDYKEYDQKFLGLTTYQVRQDPKYPNKPAITLTDTNRHRFRNTNTLSYDFKKFLKDTKHSVNILLGHEYVITKKRVNTEDIRNFPADFNSTTAWKLSGQGTPNKVDDNYSADDKLLSFFTRANYNYDDKYLLSFTFRADASSKFSSENRWGYFPSAAAAWRISSEKFMSGTKKWLDDLKLRLSFGTAGNNNIPVGQLTQAYVNVTGDPTGWVNGFGTMLKVSSEMANPNLKWETTITRNVGLDFTLLGGKLSGTVDAYLNTTKDLLIRFLTSGTGYDAQYRNMGKTENKGLEATLTWHAVNKKDWGIDLSGNLGVNKGKIKSIGDMSVFGAETRWASSDIGQEYKIRVGGQVGEIYGYQSAGRYEVSDFDHYDPASDTWVLKEGVADASAVIGTVRPGSMKLVDQATVTNEDGTKSGNGIIGEEDKVKIGNVNPDVTGGFALNARAYGFDLAANFNFSIGNQVYNANKIECTQTGKYQYRNMITEMADGKRWTNLNEDGTLCNDPEKLEEMNKNTTMWSPYTTNKMVLTDWAIEKASFLRLNTLTLGYTIPQSLTKRIGINSLRFYATAYNVFTITSYTGFDPESDCIKKKGQESLTPSCDYSGYPRSRSFVFGVNLNF
jgi:TonB-linked SusC/RagA family outer membrane protein